MRNLTIKREKTFASSLIKMKIYIEDYETRDITINGIPCRKLGKVKNGESVTFQIENQPAKVFVISDKLSKGFSNDFYQLDGGEEDIFLSGENRYNPLSGNAFRFHNNDNPEALKNRKKGNRKGILVLIAALIVGVLNGLASTYFLPSNTPADGIFHHGEMSISLNQDFGEYDFSEYGYDTAFISDDVSIYVLKEDFSLFEGYEVETLEDYADVVITANREYMPSKVQSLDGIPYFTSMYYNEEYDETYRYVTFLYESDSAYWTIEFTTLSEDFAEYEEQINNWAKSVSFDGTNTSI